MDPFSALIGAGANLLGGVLGQSNAANIAAQNIAYQKQFAQQGIQWRVADAKAAGINPLAALGAQTSSFSNIVGDNSLGTGVAAAGQDLGRAAHALSSDQMKQAELDTRAKELTVKGLEQDVISKQMDNAKSAVRLNQPGSGPGLPQVNIPLPHADPRRAGALPAMQDYWFDDGHGISRVTLPSEKASQAMQNLASAPGGAVIAGELFRRWPGNWQDALPQSDAWGYITAGRRALQQYFSNFNTSGY